MDYDIEDLNQDPHIPSNNKFNTSIEEVQKHANLFCKFYRGVLDTRFNIKNKQLYIQKHFMAFAGKQYSNSFLIRLYRYCLSENLISSSVDFEEWICVKKGRSASGVVVVTLLLPPNDFSCEFDCHYCPNDPKIARSYLLEEPAVLRGFKNGWDPIKQMANRMEGLNACGHKITKLEIIIAGGTWDSHKKNVREEFIRDVYYAANVFSKELRERYTLEEEQKINETTDCRIIGITIETRPDMISAEGIKHLRYLGVTRVQLGVQHVNNQILDLVNRRCPTHKTIIGIEKLYQNGFKVDLHWMPDLPGSNPEIDKEMFEFLFSDENTVLRGDQLKIYPTMVLIYTKILEWYENGKTLDNPSKPMYHPYAEKDNGIHISNLIKWIILNCPTEVRLNRIIRDFCSQHIKGGTDIVNWRAILEKELQDAGLYPSDIRGREVKTMKFNPNDVKIHLRKYRSSKGTEFFISIEDELKKTLHGFTRLRIPDNPTKNIYFDALKNSTFIRELHVYGKMIGQNTKSHGASQHQGLGRLLIHIAEYISILNGWNKIAIIAGIGVRDYYTKHGYSNQDTYMCKMLMNTIECPEKWLLIRDQFISENIHLFVTEKIDDFSMKLQELIDRK